MNMKVNNKIIISVFIIIILVISSFTLNFYKKNNDYKEEITKLKEELDNLKDEKTQNVDYSTSNEFNDSRLIKLSVEELEEKVNNKETFILVVTQTTCGHCISYKPTLESVLEETSQIAYEIDIQPLSQEVRQRVYKIAKVSGTPTTVFIFNGVEQDTSLRLSGSVSRDTLKQRMKDTGYIK